MRVKREEKISSDELWCTICIFVTASVMIVPIGALAGNQSWISIIIAIVIALGYTWVYACLCDSHPEKSIVEISEVLLGKWVGKTIGILYALYGFHIASLVMRDYHQFTLTVALPNTPRIVIALTAIVLVIWATYAGIETIGRISIVFIPIIILYTVISFVLLSKDMDFRNLLPVFDIKWREVLYSALQIIALPFGEIILFTMILPSVNKTGNTKKTSLLGAAVAGMLVITTNVMNIFVLGNMGSKLIYPSYASYSYIQVSDFLDRAEILIYTVFIVMHFIKISVCVYVSAVSLSKTLNSKDYRFLLIPIGILVVELSTFVEPSQSRLIEWITYVVPFYNIPVQLLIPLFLLILTSAKKKRKKPV